MPVVQSAGVPIHYELVGAGPPIVLVPVSLQLSKAIGARAGWIDFLVALGRMVVGLDIRGHGESGKPRDPAAYDLQLMAGDVLAVMDAVHVSRADLMGYSMGGRIAMELLAALTRSVHLSSRGRRNASPRATTTGDGRHRSCARNRRRVKHYGSDGAVLPPVR